MHVRVLMPGVQGTWEFMSMRAQLSSTRLTEIPDDLESFFHVLICFAVRFLSHNLSDDLVGRFLYRYFNDYTDGPACHTCGYTKYEIIKGGTIDITPITGFARGKGIYRYQHLVFFQPRADTIPSDDKVTTKHVDHVAARVSHHINALIAEFLEAFQASYDKGPLV